MIELKDNIKKLFQKILLNKKLLNTNMNIIMNRA